jgi:hypothetical protein
MCSSVVQGLLLGASLLAIGGCGGDRDLASTALAAPGRGSCTMFPPDNPWNQDITNAPVDPQSDRYLREMNAHLVTLHADFSSSPGDGIPWVAVPPGQPRVPVTFTWPDESDPGPYPFPLEAPVEGDGASVSDRHVIALDRGGCRLYEAANCSREGNGWRCDSGAIFELGSNRLRPLGWTSADAAGLPILPGLVRRDEVLAGEIRHALRFTVGHTQRAFVVPATHYASDESDPGLPPMGLRVRLRASYDISRWSGAARVILAALKRYGMFLADNGADWFISGESNPAWNDAELAAIESVPASAFEVLLVGPIHR